MRPQPAYWRAGPPSPGGERIAVWLNANVGDPPSRTPPSWPSSTGPGASSGRAQSPTSAGASQNWSPDGTKLAYRLGPDTGLRIRAFAGPDAAAAPFALGPIDSRPTTGGAVVAEWSPDARWISARAGSRSPTTPPARSWTLTTSSAAPSWRP